MENIKISHTALPDGSIIKYSNGMDKPKILNLGNVMKKSLFNAVQQKRKATKVIKLKPAKQVSRSMYAVK